MPKKVIRTNPKKIGASPGTLIHVGERRVESPRISLIEYTPERFSEKSVAVIDSSLAGGDGQALKWLNIDGIHQVDILEQCGVCFDLHPLVLEDVLNTFSWFSKCSFCPRARPISAPSRSA
jgi:magnesium transporter